MAFDLGWDPHPQHALERPDPGRPVQPGDRERAGARHQQRRLGSTSPPGSRPPMPMASSHSSRSAATATATGAMPATTRTGRSSSRTSSATRPRTGSTGSTSTSRTASGSRRTHRCRDDHLHRGDLQRGSLRRPAPLGRRDHELGRTLVGAEPGVRRSVQPDDLRRQPGDHAGGRGGHDQPGAAGLEVRRRGRRRRLSAAARRLRPVLELRGPGRPDGRVRLGGRAATPGTSA